MMNSNKNKKNPDFDWLTRLLDSALALLIFFFTQPYRGIIYRIKENPNHLYYMFYFQTVCVVLGYFWGFSWLFTSYERSFFAHIISPAIFKHIEVLTFFFSGHLYLFIWRMPWLRRESVFNSAIERLGLVPACNGGKIKLITDRKLDEEQRCIVIANPGLSLSTYKSKKEDIEAMLKKNITDISFGKDSHVVNLTYRTMVFPKVIRYADFHKLGEAPTDKFGIGL